MEALAVLEIVGAFASITALIRIWKREVVEAGGE